MKQLAATVSAFELGSFEASYPLPSPDYPTVFRKRVVTERLELQLSRKMRRDVANLIEEVKRQIKWPVTYECRKGLTPQCVSDDLERSHAIRMPPRPAPFWELGFLHEHVHALFHERFRIGQGLLPVRNLFDRNRSQVLEQVLKNVDDWFVEGWIVKNVPEAQKTVLRVSLNYFSTVELGATYYPTFRELLLYGYLLAAAIRHLGLKVSVNGVLTNVIEAFLSVSPFSPALRNTEILVNDLLRISNKPFIAKATIDGNNVLLWDCLQ